MRSSLFVGVLVVVGLGACGDKKCPPCPDPGTGTGTAYPVADAAEGDDYGNYEFRLVQQEGKVGFVGTSKKTGRVVVVPVDPRTRMFADGKTGTAGELMTFAAADNGGCPCMIPRCFPYCRVAATVLDLQPAEFWGSADMPTWSVPANAPTQPAQPVPAPTP
jgi:hypothetical protein